MKLNGGVSGAAGRPSQGKAESRLQAVTMAPQVPTWLVGCGIGRVHSLFPRACNLAWGEWLISLVMPSHGVVPGGISVQLPAAGAWGFTQDERLYWDAEAQALVGNRTRLELAKATVWSNQPPVSALPPVAQQRMRLAALVETLQQHGRGELVRMGTQEEAPSAAGGWAAYAWPYIQGLVSGLVVGDQSQVEAGLGRVLGLGEGLTPSCDDLLIGLLSTLHYGRIALTSSQVAVVEWLANELDQRAPRATTDVSANYLRLATRGGFGEHLEQVVLSLLSAGELLPGPAAVRLIETGHSSGSDTLVGVLLGARLLIDQGGARLNRPVSST